MQENAIAIRERIAHAKNYPFGAPQQSYVFANGETLPLIAFHREFPGESTILVGGGEVSLAHHLHTAGIDPATANEPRLPVIASGSNAAPDQLVRKFGTTFWGTPRDVVIPVVRANLRDFAPVYSAHIASYGSIPATLQYAPGVSSPVFVTWLTAEQMERMHETEAIGFNYGFAQVGGIRLAFPGLLLDQAYAYLSLRGCLHVEGDHFTLDPARSDYAGPVSLRPISQHQVQALVRDLLAPGMPLDGFIAENVRDKSVRQKRSRMLRAFSHPIAYKQVMFSHGTAGDLFQQIVSSGIQA